MRALLLFLSLFVAALAHATPVKTPHVEAELITRMAAMAPGKPIEAAVRLKIIPHWHVYWQNPGDSGLPTRLTWNLPAGFSAGAISWPHPMRLPLGPLMNFGYEGEVLHLVTLTAPANLPLGERVSLSVKADWLVCKDVCIPEEATLKIELPVVAGEALPSARWVQAFTNARQAVPVPLTGWVSATELDAKNLTLTLTPPAGESPPLNDVFFYPHRPELIANAGKQVLTKTATGWQLTVPLTDSPEKDAAKAGGVLVNAAGWGKAHAGAAVWVGTDGAAAALKPNSGAPLQAKTTQTPQPDLSFFAALGLALLGGLILNLMPCVFPVLGIKVMGFVETAHGDTSALKKQGLAFLAGVLLSFLLLAGLMLALRAGGAAIGWGFQLQEPGVVAALAVLFFLMALNLSGVFEMGMALQGAAGDAELKAQKSPLMGAFASGILATVVASPCMAPGLGAAVGFTLSQSTVMALLIFLVIGLGLALPVVALAFFPKLLRFLPKPGAWMVTFKQFMAFPLYATVVWLVWVLGQQTGNDGAALLLIALTVIALAAWLYGHWQVAKPTRAAFAGVAVALAGAGFAWAATTMDAPSANGQAENGWVPYSKTKLAELRAEGKPVFLDFTASWCITCQVNKRVAMNQPEVTAAFAAKKVIKMKADWTLKSAPITAALAEFGRNGVPLNVYYPVNGEPVILPEVLTSAVIVKLVEGS